MDTDKIYKALEIIADNFASERCSAETLIKACDNYKQKTAFDDNLDYQLIISKSIRDYLNNIPQDEELVKGILPGQTKVVDGVLYVWSPTASGSKQPYDWHVVKVTRKGVTVGKGSHLTPSEEQTLTKEVNSLFPTDLSQISPVPNTTLGGSTGAKLYQDASGREYIKKVNGRDTNGNKIKGHIEAEYIANQIYDLLGLKAKRCELYDDNGENVLLTKYERGLKNVTSSDEAKMAQGFITDVLLANWDVFKNDNCLVDHAGRIVRVDNGGVFDFKARGDKSANKFTDDVLETFKGMVTHNGSIYSHLTEKDIKDQIQAIRARKKEIVGYLDEAGLSGYAKTMGERIDNLTKITEYLNRGKGIANIKVSPRKIKSPNEMYRDIPDEELLQMQEDFINDHSGMTKKRSLEYTEIGNHGWELLWTICHERGFDGRPQVVSDDEYWKLLKKHGGERQFFRGVGPNPSSNMTSEDVAINTLYEEKCYYGTRAAWGEGIYVAQNDLAGYNTSNEKHNYKQSYAYSESSSYARSNSSSNDRGVVMRGMLAPDAKTIEFDKLVELSKNYVFDIDDDGIKDELKNLDKDLTKVNKELNKLDDEIRNFSNNLEKQVHKEFNFDPVKHAGFESTLDSIDWSKKDIAGDPDVPSWKDLVVKEIVPYAKSLGMKIEDLGNEFKMSLPGVKENFSISQYQYEGPFALKRRNVLSRTYNNSVERFRDYVEQNVITRMEKELLERKENSKSEISKLQKEYEANSDKRDKIEKQRKDLVSSIMPSEKTSFLVQLTGEENSRNNPLLGLLAASLGYDAITTSKSSVKGAYSSSGYTCVLNRTKLIFSNEIDYL